MKNLISLTELNILSITDGSRNYDGANQAWYPERRKQIAGCGPTTCAQIMWYLSRTQAERASLCPYQGRHQNEILKLMEDLWEYVTPGPLGVNKTTIFAEGAVRYGQDNGVPLTTDTIQVGHFGVNDGKLEEVTEFLKAAFQQDLPVGFLNLSNGKLTNLESWHWVLAVGIDPERKILMIYDQGETKRIDLKLWLETTLLGGGFVIVKSI